MHRASTTIAPRPLVSAVAAVLGIAMSIDVVYAAPAVTNCLDAGTGSLRAALAAAASGDTLDLSGLQCSKISLKTGLTVTQASLKIVGPGKDALTLDGGGVYQQGGIFRHIGNGTLEVDQVSLTNGFFYTNDNSVVGGGCVSSTGNVVVTDVSMDYCTIKGGAKTLAGGGGIYALGDVNLIRTQIRHGFAEQTNYEAIGAGVLANGKATLTDSGRYENYSPYAGAISAGKELTMTGTTIDSNRTASNGGAVSSGGSITIIGSTLSRNVSDSGPSTIFSSGHSSDTLLTITDSTISGNRAEANGLAVTILTFSAARISNSTIAFNLDLGSSAYGAIFSVGPTLQIDSSIIAENFPADIYASRDFGDYTTFVFGERNLIQNTSNVPSSVITSSACPQLDRLQNNGGGTKTHALRAKSPALDAGEALTSLLYDQRGPGYPRQSGSAPDIGALEWHGEVVDGIFHASLDYPSAWCDR